MAERDFGVCSFDDKIDEIPCSVEFRADGDFAEKVGADVEDFVKLFGLERSHVSVGETATAFGVNVWAFEVKTRETRAVDDSVFQPLDNLFEFCEVCVVASDAHGGDDGCSTAARGCVADCVECFVCVVEKVSAAVAVDMDVDEAGDSDKFIVGDNGVLREGFSVFPWDDALDAFVVKFNEDIFHLHFGCPEFVAEDAAELFIVLHLCFHFQGQ